MAAERSLDASPVDASLLSLTRREARCRLELGRLAAAFLARSGHHRLGFARLGDYTRERLGLSGREVQALASVASRLVDLPRVAGAFVAGELSWSQVRLLAAAATPEGEEEWLERARGKTVRALLAEFRGGDGGGTRGAPSGPELREIIDDETGAIDGEETVRVRIGCPARVRVLWRRALELARRMLGAQAPLWQAGEAIAAEGFAAAPAGDTNEAGRPAAEAESGSFPESVLPSAGEERPLPSINAVACARVDEDRSLAEDGETVDAAFGLPSRVDPSRANATESTIVAGPDAVELPVATVASVFALDTSGLDVSGLDAFTLDERMCDVVRALQGLDAETAGCLRVAVGAKLYRAFGFASFEAYARERLGLSPSRAWALVRIARRSAAEPALARAFRRGELSWVRLQTILPVASGAEAARWVRRAREVTLRGLAVEVERALDAADLQMCARRRRQAGPGNEQEEIADREVTFCAPASVAALFRDAVSAFTPAGEPGWKGLERLLAHAIDEWSSQPRHRDPVFERDGWRCAVPACSSRRNLHDHHRQFRSRGGTNERSNRVTTCAWHHLRGIHGGLVAVSGTAPDGLTWRLGLRPGREALLVLDGDRYVRGL